MASSKEKNEKVFSVPLPLKVPMTLSATMLRDNVLLAKDFILMNGGLMRTAALPNSSDTAAHVPFLLFPSPFPRRLFNLAMSIQQDFHNLVHRMALDRDFLYTSLKYIIETDSFTRRLWELYEEVYSNKDRLPRLYMGTTRNDYMLHKPRDSTEDLGIKQVEYNMIAVSFGPLETIVNRWHKFIVGRLLGQDVAPLCTNENGSPNEPGVGLARTVVKAANTYKEIYSCTNVDTYVLIVADSPARNIFDQRWIELAMLEADPSVKTIRRTMAQLRTAIDIEEVKRSGRLLVEGHEIAVVYYRTGYNEGDYAEGDWELVRRPIELSRAVKTPCVAHQLANYKKIQQIIARPGQLERFGLTGDECSRMRQTFTDLLGLEFGDAGEKAVERGIANCEDFVLKPMAEGGGHNYFGSAVADELRKLRNKAERQNFILMELIRPPLNENFSVAPGEPVDEPRIGRFSSELGIYGGFIVVDGRMVQNQALGYLLRSKPDGVNESGVAAGFGRIDSAYFTD